MEDMFQVDYTKNLSIVAVTGAVGFKKIIDLGMYGVNKLFNKLPYNAETTLEEGTVTLRCNFEREK